MTHELRLAMSRPHRALVKDSAINGFWSLRDHEHSSSGVQWIELFKRVPARHSKLASWVVSDATRARLERAGGEATGGAQ